MAKATPAPKKPLTKTELMANIAAATDVPKKQVAAVLEALAAEIKKAAAFQPRKSENEQLRKRLAGAASMGPRLFSRGNP